MASYHKSKFKKPWSVRFLIVENGIEKHKRLSGFSTKTEAHNAYLDFMANYKDNEEKYELTNTSKLYYDELLPKYLTFSKLQTKESTHIDKIQVFARFITPALKGKRLELLDKEFYYNWHTNLWLNNYSFKYKTKIRGYLNNFLNWVGSIYELPNRLQFIKIPKRIEPKKEMQIWELKDIEIFEKECNDILYKTLIMFQFYTGNRIGETLALTDKDISSGHILINKNYTEKTTNTVYKIVPTTKNYINRKTPIPTALQEQIDVYLKWKKENNISSDFLFGGEKPLAPTTIRRHFDFYTTKASLKRIRIHDLRHSYVSMLIHLGVSSKVIAELIGDKEEQVIKTYSHVYSGDKEKAIDILNEIVGNKVGNKK